MSREADRSQERSLTQTSLGAHFGALRSPANPKCPETRSGQLVDTVLKTLGIPSVDGLQETTRVDDRKPSIYETTTRPRSRRQGRRSARARVAAARVCRCRGQPDTDLSSSFRRHDRRARAASQHQRRYDAFSCDLARYCCAVGRRATCLFERLIEKYSMS